ncbi:MAG TPA: hypothetical protein VKG26_10320 [Bacteroidia bacterium]|nr:hypothetical protein [Bacteroidia bacterium]
MRRLWLLLFFISVSVFGQTAKDNNSAILLDAYLTVNTGLCMPIGDFGSNNYKNPNAGFAMPAANFEVSYIGRFYELIGLALMFKNTTMAMNFTPAETYYNANDTNYYWAGAATPIKVKMAMIGLYSLVPVTKAKNLFVFIKPMIGLGFVNATSTTYELFEKQLIYAPGSANPVLAYSNGTITYTQQAAHALAYNFGLGLKYNLSPIFSLMFQADYSVTKPLFQSGIEISTTHYSNQQDLMPKLIKIQTLNFNLGLSLKVKG